MASNYRWPTLECRSKRLEIDEDDGAEVADRQDRVPGFSTEVFGRSRLVLIGAGGLGGGIATGVARKGIGQIDIVDPDVVEVSNLNRQVFFEKDLFQPKALRLAENVSKEGFLGGVAVGHFVEFTEETAIHFAGRADIVVCAVDSNQARATASRFFRRQGVPVIHTAVDESASFCWVFVDKPDGPCIGCVFPRMAAASVGRQPCRPLPAVLDILRVAGGLVLYGIDTVLMDRPRYWNYRSVHLAGGSPDINDTVAKREGCQLCQSFS